MTTHTVIAIIYLGAFSRFTHGAYTPGFYEYQLGRAPDDASTWMIPYVDAALATLALVRATRSYALFFCAAAQVMALGQRVWQGSDAVPDTALLVATMVALVTAAVGDIKAAKQ